MLHSLIKETPKRDMSQNNTILLIALCLNDISSELLETKIFINLLRLKYPMELKRKLKEMIIEELQIEDITPDEIDDDAPLFGEGLELDSLDAVELVVQLQVYFGVEIKNIEEGRPALQSINTLANFIMERQKISSDEGLS